MQFTLKDHEGHPYIEYFDEVNNYKFTNKEYFIFDITNEDFKAIVNTYGKRRTVSLLTNIIQQKEIPCESIMFCHTPKENNSFCFQIVFLGEDREVLYKVWDNYYCDYKDYKELFSSCIIERGCIFDLLEKSYFSEVTKEFKTPTICFDLKVNGKGVEPDDVLVCRDISQLTQKETQEKIKKYNIAYAELNATWDGFHLSYFLVRFVKEDGSYLTNYEEKFGSDSFEDFYEKYGKSYIQEDIDYYCEPFECNAYIPNLRNISEYLEIKEKEDFTFEPIEDYDER